MVMMDIHNDCHKIIVESRRYKTVKDVKRERISSMVLVLWQDLGAGGSDLT